MLYLSIKFEIYPFSVQRNLEGFRNNNQACNWVRKLWCNECFVEIFSKPQSHNSIRRLQQFGHGYCWSLSWNQSPISIQIARYDFCLKKRFKSMGAPENPKVSRSKYWMCFYNMIGIRQEKMGVIQNFLIHILTILSTNQNDQSSEISTAELCVL